MSDRPKLLCPRCGRHLRGEGGTTCPDCGYVISITRLQHRGRLSYWDFLRTRRRLEIVAALTWLVAGIFGCWLLSLAPGWGFAVLTFVAGLGVVGVGRLLTVRRERLK